MTEIIGSGKVRWQTTMLLALLTVVHQVDMGAKAMIHTIAGKARGFPIKSIGTMMDEPFTGLVYLKDSGITHFKDIKGRKIGYVGEFGKVQVSDYQLGERNRADVDRLAASVRKLDE